jgi:[FeFe] hydrogenase H-cluster maturation GTPase HydF
LSGFSELKTENATCTFNFNAMTKGKDLKPHIGIFGRRNNGKSSFINALTGQDVAIVSETPGTTTDPVKKSLEIFGVGPAIIIDTAGIDDSGELGNKRIQKSLQALKSIDLAILLISENTWGDHELSMIRHFEQYDLPFIIVHNKLDLQALKPETRALIEKDSSATLVECSSTKHLNIDAVVDAIKKEIPETAYQHISIFDDLIKPKDLVVLVTPIDSEAPEGRMILPQVMAIRDVLDQHCICVVVRETELDDFITNCNLKPALVVTDSQAFSFVSSIVPADIPLTGFSILFARLKGNFDKYTEGTPAIGRLKDGDKVLILESCTHRVSCDDIGRFKIPNWLKEKSGKQLELEVVSGLDQSKEPIANYALVIQCGGCVFTRRQVMNRLKPAIDAGVPVTNYGMAIAWMKGIFERAIKPLNPEL